MIAKHIPMHSIAKSSFAGLAEYITDKQSKEHRLGEVTLTNCDALDVEMAICEIVATQEQNTRAKSDKTFHLLVSFRPDEKPDTATLKAIEDKICEGLGFGEHQRISAVHHDTDNLHIHIAINKIHPERLTIHEPYYPYKTLAKLCATLEQEYGLQVDNHEPKRTAAEGRAMDMEHHSGMESLLGWIQRECLSEIKAADTWEKLHEVMEGNGLSLRVKANGVVFESQKTGVQVKASSVARDLSKSKLEARLGAFEAATARAVESTLADKPASQANALNEAGAGDSAIQQKAQAMQPQPKRQYEKKPLRFGVDTTVLYARYQDDQRRRGSIQKRSLKQLREQKTRRIDEAKRSAQSQREAIKRMSGSAQAKKARYTQASSALLGTISAINAQYRQACKNLYAENSRHTWVDWLRQKSIAGDREALTALRSRPNQGFKKRVLLRQTPNRAPGTIGLGVRVPLEAYKAVPLTDNITKQGTVIYRLGASSVRESGNGLQIPKEATRQQMQNALRFAMQHYGKCLSMNGDLEFKAQMIKAAVDSGLPVTFADPLLERKRQELLQGKHHERASGQALDRGRTGRPASQPFQHATATAGRAAYSVHNSAHDSAQHGGQHLLRQPDAVRAGTPPPPVARDRMRGLSERGLAGLKTGIEMLLPPVVSIFLRQPGTESDSLLRRGRGLLADVVSEAKKALQAAKPQHNTQGQGTGRGL